MVKESSKILATIVRVQEYPDVEKFKKLGKHRSWNLEEGSQRRFPVRRG